MAAPEIDSKLDVALGLSLESAEDGVATLLLEPGEPAVVEDQGLTYLHGGALATCIDTAAWYAADSAAPGGEEDYWVISGLSFEALRLAGDEPHTVVARCVRAGRTRAVVDVEIAPRERPERLVTVGRVSLSRAPRN